MRASVDALFDNPQNNLCVLRHGDKQVVADIDPAERAALSQGLAAALEESKVLPAVLAAQLKTAVDPVQAAKVPEGTEEVWVHAEEWPIGRESQCSKIRAGQATLADVDKPPPPRRAAPPEATKLAWKDVVRDFQVTRSAQDCSVMVMLSKKADGDGYEAAGVKVIDVDIKAAVPVRLQYWSEQSRKFCSNFRKKYGAEKKSGGGPSRRRTGTHGGAAGRRSPRSAPRGAEPTSPSQPTGDAKAD